MQRFRLFFLVILTSLAPPSLAAIPLDTLVSNSLLYNGSEYIKPFNPQKGTPMFPTENNKGDVHYYGNWYKNLDLLYDLEDDILVTKDAQGLLKLKLIKEKLESFTIDGHLFVKLKLLNARGEFYEQLHKGKRNLMLQWEKKMELDAQEMPIYVLRKTLFVMEGEKVMPLLRADDLLNINPEHFKDVKKALRTQKLSFKKDPVKASLSIVKFLEDKGW
jgi:hypothetical protein